MGYHYLNKLFAPKSIAVFWASTNPESVGSRILENLREGQFGGELYPVNPKHNSICT